MTRSIQLISRKRNRTLLGSLLSLTTVALLCQACFPAPHGSMYGAAPSYLDISSNQARFGSASLSADFQPHPYNLSGVSGGVIDSSYLGTSHFGACRGFTQNTPNHILYLNSSLERLRVEAISDGHVSLMIMGPEGWWCSSDSRQPAHGGQSPVIDGTWQAGTYRVWVASVGYSIQYNYNLALSRESYTAQPPQPTTPSVSQPGELDTDTWDSRNQSLVLRPGFRPDPQQTTGVAGGGLAADYLGISPSGPCAGNHAATPNHILTLERAFDFLDLSVVAEGDSTLVIHGPDGWLCNDDRDGLNPGISGRWSQGTYRVWVGNHRREQQLPYSMTLTAVAPSQTTTVELDLQATTARHESLQLLPGFSPTPRTISGVSGGTNPADMSYLGHSSSGACGGYADPRPGHVLRLERDFGSLRIAVQAEESEGRRERGRRPSRTSTELTLVVHGPNGLWCASGQSPEIVSSFSAGLYRIWVGSSRADAQNNYTLQLSEIASTTLVQPDPATLEPRPGVTVQPRPGMTMQPRPVRPQSRHDSFSLGHGFSPDPRQVNGISGGRRSASELGGAQTRACNGFTEDLPSHVMTLESDFSLLRIDVQSTADTTLIMEGPDGWYCDDDTVDLNPRLMGSYRQGTYRIWVGNYFPDERDEYTLTVTTRRPR